MTDLRMGVVATSSKENEFRLPIHPQQFDRIDENLRSRIILERGYGQRYGVSDERLEPLVAGMADRREVIDSSDIVLLPKPTLEDLRLLNEGQVLWGWPHAVQDQELTQIAIDKRLTLIAWEAMNHWTPDGEFVVHVFHLNNEMAGYCSALQAMTLIGSTGHYGRQLDAAVIGFGNTARGAITGLHGLGIHDVTALTMRDVTAVASPIPGVGYVQMFRDDGDGGDILVETSKGDIPIAEYLSGFDVIVNCVMQDTDNPMMFVTDAQVGLFGPGQLIVDVSCDRGMGFQFARPTSFEDPMFHLGDGLAYYGVDHSPSYLWNSATWGISEALIPFIGPVMQGPAGWDSDMTIHRAIEIRDGMIQNPKILSFQGRHDDYPHQVTFDG